MSKHVGLDHENDMMSPTSELPDTTMELDEEKGLENSNHSPLQYCTKLEKIILRNNQITKIFIDWTFVPTNLKSLDLSRNKIKSLHPRDLYFVSQ
jgi:Leucine-rich repeat (LRR) protein